MGDPCSGTLFFLIRRTPAPVTPEKSQCRVREVKLAPAGVPLAGESLTCPSSFDSSHLARLETYPRSLRTTAHTLPHNHQFAYPSRLRSHHPIKTIRLLYISVYTSDQDGCHACCILEGGPPSTRSTQDGTTLRVLPRPFEP